MSEDKVYHCLNNACRETFKHWMQRSRHLEKGCKGTPKEKPVEIVVKSGTGYVCKICNTTRILRSFCGRQSACLEKTVTVYLTFYHLTIFSLLIHYFSDFHCLH